MDIVIIVIDDERTFANHMRFPDPIYARNSNQGLAVIARHWAKWATKPSGAIPRISELWLDHDLGEDDTIMPVVDFLLAIDDEDFIGQIYVHSQNPSGAESVYNALRKHYFCQPAPLPELLVEGKAKAPAGCNARDREPNLHNVPDETNAIGYNSDGWLNVYTLLCGYQELLEIGDTRFRLWFEGAAYHFLSFNSVTNERTWDSFADVDEARKAYASSVENYQES